MGAAHIMRLAEITTGLATWGEPDFANRLALWVDTIQRDSGLSLIGRASAEGHILRYAVNRLRLEALVAAYPEIELVELPAPIIVTGLPRSGTTALARLLADGPGLRSPTYWEAADPFGPDSPQRRRARADRECQQTVAAMPGIDRFHEIRAEAFADDHELQGLAFGGLGLELLGCSPAIPPPEAPNYLRRAMQALSWLRGGPRWVIKSPGHMDGLPGLLQAFPDAVVVVSIRQGAEASMQRMVRFLDRHLRTEPTPVRYWPERMAGMARAYAETRHCCPSLFELPAEQWSAEPEKTRREVWEAAGLNLQMAELAT